VAAVIDWLLHHCHILIKRGNFYPRRRHSELWRSVNPPTEEYSASTTSLPLKGKRKNDVSHPVPLTQSATFDPAKAEHPEGLPRFW